MAAEEKITLETLRDKFNELSGKHNDLLAAFQDSEAARAADAQRMGALELAVRQLSTAPHPGNVGVPAEVLQRITFLEESAQRIPLNPMQAKAEQQRAMAQEASRHQGDRMMYHPNLAKGAQIVRVVRNDKEEKQAVKEGYLGSQEAAAKQALGGKGTDAAAVAEYIDKMRAAMFKAA